jgi:Ca2+-binding EF-hand superfamily protein
MAVTAPREVDLKSKALERTPPDVQDVIAKVQATAFPRRLRIRDLFVDYDTRRSLRVSRQQFIRALDYAAIKVTHEEAEVLADYFLDAPTGDVHYGRFAEAIDLVFGTKHLEATPCAEVPMPGQTVGPVFKPNAPIDERNMEILEYIMHRVALLTKTRGVVLKYLFKDFDKLNSGFVTEQQFRRQFPFTAHFLDEEMDILVDRYTDRNRSALNGINYRALHEDVTERANAAADPPFPRSDLVLRTDKTERWTSDTYEPEEKVQAFVVERRIRLRDPFTDFDPLRKGYVTVGQARSILASSVRVQLPKEDMDRLIVKYTREDGMFHYAAFCDVVDEAFTVKGLETQPLVRICMPDATTTLPARRNQLILSDQQIFEVERLEEDIRARVQQRRIFLKPMFQDFDPSRRSHISKSQFARALGTLGFELTEEEVNLFGLKYCDLGNKFDVNYLLFCEVCDPAVETLIAKNEDRRCNLRPDATYFTRRYDSGVVSGPASIAGRCGEVVPYEVSNEVVSGTGKLDRSHMKILSTN